MGAGAPPRRRRVGSRAVATLAVLLGAGAVVLAAGRPWFSTTVVGLPGPDLVTTTGRSVAPGAPALGLVAAAGAIVLATSGRAVRTVVAVLLALAGAGIVAASVGPLRDPSGALEPVVATATGTTGGFVAFVAHGTPWPLVSVVGGVLVAAGGVLAVVRGRRWSGPSQRFERAGPAEGAERGGAPPGAPAAGAPDSGAPAAGAPVSGETRDGEVTTMPTGTKVTVRPVDPGAGSMRSGKDERLDAWDRLSAGEDPTD